MPPLRERVVDALRLVFGDEREARREAESPSAAALAAQPSSMFSLFGRDEIGGLLSVSQVLMDRFADYEAMEEYPDIGCLAEGTLLHVIDQSVVKAVPIEVLATDMAGARILAYDEAKRLVVPVDAVRPRLTSVKAPVVKLQLSNGRAIRCTPDHKFLLDDRGYVEAKDLRGGNILTGMFAGFEPAGTRLLTSPRAGSAMVVADPVPDGEARVFDVTTETANFMAEGVVVHNSAYRYFAFDAVQPSVTDGRAIWTNSDDDAIKGINDDLLHKRLRAEYDLPAQAYNLALYGNCAAFGSRVWGDTLREIQDVQPGASITVFKDGESATLPVAQTFQNGTKPVFHVRTRHREVTLTENHPVLVELASGEREWRAVRDLKVEHLPSGEVDDERTPKLVICTRMLNGEDKTWAQATGHPLDVEGLSETIEPLFCRLFGFAIGDGSSGERQPQPAMVGAPQAVTAHYGELAQRLVARAYHHGEAAVDAARRLPPWVFGLPEEQREELLQGLMDANDRESKPRNATGRYFETTNKELARDVKALIDGLGYKSVNVHARSKPTKPTYVVTFFRSRFPSPFHAERLLSVEAAGEAQVFDVGVADAVHNFIADGVVVHNSFDEVLVTHRGVVGLNHLPTPTMRRVEALDGSLIGYVQDVTGQFTANSHELRPMLAGNVEIPKSIALFEDWQVVHSRLRSTSKRSTYGRCIPGDEAVSTDAGPVAMRDVKVGASVMFHDAQRCFSVTKVVSKTSNGVQPIFKVSTSTRHIRATANHPFLRTDGSWVQVSELKPGDSVVRLTGPDKIVAIEPAGEAEVFDIGVASEEHNFVCQGFVVHNSVADGARWVWKRLIMLEDAAIIYRLQRIPRYAYYIDVTDVPSDEIESHLQKVRRNLKKRKFVNPSTGRFDMRYKPLAQDEDLVIAVRKGQELARAEVLSAPDWNSNDDIDYVKRMLHGTLNCPRAWLGQDGPLPGKGPLCLTGDTKIPLLDGRVRTMKQLAEEYGPADTFFVYSVAADGRITSGQAHGPRVTRPGAEVWEVEIDNGEVVRGTPDHPFMLRDGSYQELSQLKTGDSLMPLYRRDSVAARDGIEDYDMVLDPVDGKWKFTHRLVARAKWPQRAIKGRAIHHADFDRRNNDPHNLEDMGAHDDAHLVGGYKPNPHHKNHKVVAVRQVGREDCYDFTVDEHHNFAVAAGVFVHNSNEDVRAARVTLTLQQELKLAYERVGRIHLLARGVVSDPFAPDLNVQMTVPSGIWELAAYETLNARADYASRVAPYMSIRWLQENVFHIPEKEIEIINKQRKKEKEEEMTMGGFGGGGPGGPPAPEPPPPAGGEHPPNDLEPPEPAPNAPQGEWRAYDKARWIEEQRHKESRRNHEQLIHRLGTIMENQDDDFVAREHDRRSFMEAVRKGAITTSRAGFVSAAPSARKLHPSVAKAMAEARHGNGATH